MGSLDFGFSSGECCLTCAQANDQANEIPLQPLLYSTGVGQNFLLQFCLSQGLLQMHSTAFKIFKPLQGDYEIQRGLTANARAPKPDSLRVCHNV